jgi:hypothetical protein
MVKLEDNEQKKRKYGKNQQQKEREN